MALAQMAGCLLGEPLGTVLGPACRAVGVPLSPGRFSCPASPRPPAPARRPWGSRLSLGLALLSWVT